MRNKSFLPLMEMLCMIGVFAIASAICLQAFVKANDISEKRSELDSAVFLAQDACEILKHVNGDNEMFLEMTDGKLQTDGSIRIYYDEEHNVTDSKSAKYVLTITEAIYQDGIGQSTVSVFTRERMIYDLSVAWQEDDNENK